MRTEVIYNGKGQPGPFANQFRLKDLTFISGEKVTVSDEQAGMLLQSAPKGSVEVVSGTPVMKALLSNSAKAAIKTAAAQAKQFPTDPAAALDGLEPIPEDVVKALSGKPEDAAAFVTGGKADAVLGSVAVWAQLGGRKAVAELVARRAVALKPKV